MLMNSPQTMSEDPENKDVIFLKVDVDEAEVGLRWLHYNNRNLFQRA